MNWMDQAEEAYKNGYAAGKKDAIKATHSVPPDNREKVIFAIENCLTTDSVTECRKTECPFISCRESCLEWLLRSALALLKEQDEGIEPEISRKSVTETTVSLWYKCGACGGAIEQGDDEFCRHCGKKVKWDD